MKTIREKMCYKQALHYDRIGAFLLKFPGFVFQTQFVSVKQWTCTYKDKSSGRPKNFTTVLSEQMSAEEKEFWGSTKNVREYHKSLRPTGTLPDGTVLHFKVEKVAGDGDCGYSVIGIPREEAAVALLARLDDEEIRGMIGMECRSMLQDDIEGEDGLPESVLDDAIRRFLKNRISVQTQIDVAQREKKSTKKLIAELAEVEKRISQWCCSRDTCERFVKSYILNAEKDGYLQTAVWENNIHSERSLRTSFDALARIYGFRAGIWQCYEENGSLKFIGWVNEHSKGETVHMLHDRVVHYDRLVIVQKK